MFPARRLLKALEAHYGPSSVQSVIRAPDRYRLPDGTIFGIIASTTAPFCESCDRSRLTADGMWYLCLYATRGIDLRYPLRHGASASDIEALVRSTWEKRRDRGAEDRLTARDRTPHSVEHSARSDLEMHTRGG